MEDEDWWKNGDSILDFEWWCVAYMDISLYTLCAKTDSSIYKLVHVYKNE